MSQLLALASLLEIEVAAVPAATLPSPAAAAPQCLSEAIRAAPQPRATLLGCGDWIQEPARSESSPILHSNHRLRVQVAVAPRRFPSVSAAVAAVEPPGEPA